MRFLSLVVLLPAVAFGQGRDSGGLSEPVTLSQTLTSNVASGSTTISLAAGSKILWRSAANLWANTSFNLATDAIGFDTSGGQNSFTYTAKQRTVFANGGTNTSSNTTPSVFFNYYSSAFASGLGYEFDIPNDITSVANTFNLIRTQINTDGSAVTPFTVKASGRMVFDSTDSSGTPGAVTINKPSGKAAVDAAASSAVVTNSTVLTTSTVIISPIDLDATCLDWKAVPAAGSFTVTLNAACTAAWKFGFLVIN